MITAILYNFFNLIGLYGTAALVAILKMLGTL